MKTHDLTDLPLQAITCTCGATIDAATGDDRVPVPGDYSLCAYCGDLSEWSEDFTRIPVDFDTLPMHVKVKVTMYRASSPRIVEYLARKAEN